MTTGGPGRAPTSGLTPQEAEELAAQHGLSLVAQRPGLFAYLRDVWRHRHLMWALAKGDFVATHQDNYLGLLWSVINPLLLGLVYYLIFGLLIPGVRGGVDNFISFLTIGLFTFIPLASAMTSGSKALRGKIGMIRSLSFPRVLLPITVVLSEFVSALPAFVILVLIALATGETPNLEWLLFPVALGVVLLVSLGLGMIFARIVHAVRDAGNVVPLIVRMLRYVSGVFFSVQYSLERSPDAPQWIALILTYQPVAVLLTLVREPLMDEYAVQWQTWVASVGWGVLLFLIGFLVFWRGEGTYGRA